MNGLRAFQAIVCERSEKFHSQNDFGGLPCIKQSPVTSSTFTQLFDEVSSGQHRGPWVPGTPNDPFIQGD